MRVSTRHTLAAGAAIAGLLALGSAASAGGNGGNSGHTPVPGYGGNSGSPCCNAPKGHRIKVPGVSVAGPNISITGTNVNVHGGKFSISGETYLNVAAGAQAQSDVSAFVSGGGGGFSGPAPVAATSIDSLNVVGGEEVYTETVTEEVPIIEEYCIDEISYSASYQAIQAVCLDDTGSPHPASQVTGEQSVASDYKGELFRCMAGTRMQVTIGAVDHGEASFAHGQTIACEKGEALVYMPGGQLNCKPQIPQRNCNERSLLRRHGPGIKIIEANVAEKVCVPQQRTVMKAVTREVEKVRASAGSRMVFDGGVGQGVY